MPESNADTGVPDGNCPSASRTSWGAVEALTASEMPLEGAPTRTSGLARLDAFVPRAAGYARGRNLAIPPYSAVSRLSPYIRYRLVLERELVAAVWASHPPETVDKYVSEVLWRAYWKGWLALRPQVWPRYLEQALADLEGLGGDAADRYAAACAGRTGIDCVDAWVGELTTTGYLHNHARLWFASIWIFTLGLPWTLGAALFLRHLLDGDPASNTLSWRWVAGCTPGASTIWLARRTSPALPAGGSTRGVCSTKTPRRRPRTPRDWTPGPSPRCPHQTRIPPADSC